MDLSLLMPDVLNNYLHLLLFVLYLLYIGTDVLELNLHLML